ncbi:hypothetical protein E3N88_43093 [Mikania micrantha]|uniref:Retrovirus-related Pol polyprotein from transposon TNT 1-94-like beta-barrel domain-containing protein n=1 Tax=Mikania micrantha TaxID=192012 RepID=A0A5N6LG06_9ASTR|nr:hypothetical protein E3N88_43093 [Mikania micrantha]
MASEPEDVRSVMNDVLVATRTENIVDSGNDSSGNGRELSGLNSPGMFDQKDQEEPRVDKEDHGDSGMERLCKIVSEFQIGMSPKAIQKEMNNEFVIKDGNNSIYISAFNATAWEIWFVGLERRTHCSAFRNTFFKLKESFGIESNFGKRNSNGYILGKGSVMIKSSGIDFKIKDVFYTPSFKRNILSMRMLIDQGFEITFHGTNCSIIKPIKFEDCGRNRKKKDPQDRVKNEFILRCEPYP